MVWVAVQKGYKPEKTDVIVRRMVWSESCKKIPFPRAAPLRTVNLEALFFGDLKKYEDLVHSLAFRKTKGDCFVDANKLVHEVYKEELPKEAGPDGLMTLEEKVMRQHRAAGLYLPSQLLRSIEPINILVDMQELGMFPLRRDYRSHMADLTMNIHKGTLSSLAVNQLSFHNIEYEEMRADYRYHFGGLHLAAMIVILNDLEECIQTGKTLFDFLMLDKIALNETPPRNKKRIIYKPLQLADGFTPKFVVLNHKKEYLYLRDLVACLPQPQRSPLGNHFSPMDSGLRKMMEEVALSSAPKAEEPSPPASSPATESAEASQRGSPLACPEQLEEEEEEEEKAEEAPDNPLPLPPPPSQEIPIDLAEALLSDDYLYERPFDSSSLVPIYHQLSELWGEDLDGPM